jgi:hypothetical protein
VQRFGDIDRSSAFGAEGQQDSEMDNDEDFKLMFYGAKNASNFID